MSIEKISTKPDNTVITKIIGDQEKNVSTAKNFILECNGREPGKGGLISIRSDNHFVKVDLTPGSTILIKDLGTEIRAR